MTRRERRIILMLDNEIESLHADFVNASNEVTDMSPKAAAIHRKLCAMESLRDQAIKTFEQN